MKNHKNCPYQKSLAGRADPAPIQSSFSRSGTPPASTPGCWRSPSSYKRRSCHVLMPRNSCSEAMRSARTRTPRVGTSTSRFALTAHIWNDRQRDAELIELYAQSELSLGSSNVQRHYDI